MWARPGVSMPLLAALLLLLAGPQQAVALPLQLSPAAIADIMASYGNTSNAQNYTMKAINSALSGRTLNFAVRCVRVRSALRVEGRSPRRWPSRPGLAASLLAPL